MSSVTGSARHSLTDKIYTFAIIRTNNRTGDKRGGQREREREREREGRGYSSALINAPRGARNSSATLPLLVSISLSFFPSPDSLRDDRLISDFMPRLRAHPNSPSPKTPSATRRRSRPSTTTERYENHRPRDSRSAERSIWYLNKRMCTRAQSSCSRNRMSP